MNSTPRSPQPVVAVAQAYQALRPELHARLDLAFAGGLNVAQTVGLAREIVAHTAPDDLALVIARLIAMSTEEAELGDGADWQLPASTFISTAAPRVFDWSTSSGEAA